MIESLPPMYDVVLACADYAEINATTTIKEYAWKDAVLCAYTIRQGLTMPIFGSIVMLGVFNLPIYIRQESPLIPFVLAILLSGILLSSTSSVVQGIVTVVTLFVVGLGPLLLLMKVSGQ